MKSQRKNPGHLLIVRLYELGFMSLLLALTHWSWKTLEASPQNPDRRPGFSTPALAAPETLQQVRDRNGPDSVSMLQVAHEKDWAESR